MGLFRKVGRCLAQRRIVKHLLETVVRPPLPLVPVRLMRYEGDARFARGAVIWELLRQWAEEDGKRGKCRGCGGSSKGKRWMLHHEEAPDCWLGQLWEKAALPVCFYRGEEGEV